MDTSLFVNNLFNICRSTSDVLHVFSYALLVISFIVISIYKFDKQTYSSYVYLPITNFFKNSIATSYLLNLVKRIFAASHSKRLQWAPSSSRVIYFTKKIKKISKMFSK